MLVPCGIPTPTVDLSASEAVLLVALAFRIWKEKNRVPSDCNHKPINMRQTLALVHGYTTLGVREAAYD